MQKQPTFQHQSQSFFDCYTENTSCNFNQSASFRRFPSKGLTLIIQIQKNHSKIYMSTKSTYSKVNSLSLSVESVTAGNEPSFPPKTPIKRHPNEHQHSFFATLSPLPFPPKLDVRITQSSFNTGSEMRYVQTPVPKENSKLLPQQEQDPMNYAITNRIIFESSDEDAQNNSSSLQSSSQMDEENSSNQNSQNSREDSDEDQQNEKSLQEEGHQEISGQGKNRRSSKGRGTSNANKDSNGEKKVVCNCKKTKCLKLYCDCFRLNQTCDGCNCVGCHNLDIYYEERNNAIMALMDRNPDPFGQKIEDDKHVKGCNCKKSNCLKKYCECYQAGLKCGENCKCQECKNIPLEKDGQEPEKGASKNTAKKERRMVEI